MRYLPLFLLFSFQAFFCFAQTPDYSRAKVDLTQHSLAELAALGVEVDHGHLEKGRSFTTDFSKWEIEKIRQAGFQVEILITDVQAHYREQRAAHDHAYARGGLCGGGSGGNPFTKYTTPSNYTYGSMGGYHTLSEMYAVLADMQQKFPNLITDTALVSDSIVTHEGRSLHWVKISDNPNQDEGEPKVLFTALHHCREPNGLSQMLFFMWYIMENYGTDPEVTYIVDNTELYFVPCINPDGYVFNELNDPNGGGLWRKNRRDNQDGSFGVDLNRNYGHQWGFDNQGSSPDPNSNTYRGPEAFSEPESRMMRDFTMANNFEFIQNYHTFSNLLIIPWAYSDAPADNAFVEYADLMVSENGYRDGTASQTVGYAVNGSSDDWMFAGTGAYTMTPEVGPGTFGFWPPQSAIDQLNKEVMFLNLVTAQLPLHYARLQVDTEIDPPVNNEITLPFSIKRYSLQNADFEVSLTPISAGITAVSAAQEFGDLDQFEDRAGSFTLTLDPMNSEVELKLLAHLDNGFFTRSDTVTIRVSQPSVALFEDELTMGDNWLSTTGWGLSTEHYVSAPSSMTDSPNGDSPNNSLNELFLQNAVSIPATAQDANLRFFARWSIESDYDLAFVSATSPNQSTRPLCGLYTRDNAPQWPDNPLYDGLQEEWVEECMSLKDFIGENVTLRFTLSTDGFVNFDGFYFDDVRVEYVQDGSVNSISLDDSQFRLLQNEPNPSTAQTLIRWENPSNRKPQTLSVRDALGRLVFEKDITKAATDYVKLETSDWQEGVYFYSVQFENGEQTAPVKMLVAGK